MNIKILTAIRTSVATILLMTTFQVTHSCAAQPEFDDPNPQRYKLSARASEIDPRVRAHPELGFLLETDQGKPADVERAMVDTQMEPRGRLVIWLMGYNGGLFDRLASYGLHAIQVQYARGWFSLCCQERPVGESCRGDIRLEAATGDDYSSEVQIPKPDSMAERAFQFVQWLDHENRQGNWGQFINDTKDGLRWNKVILAGASHGSTTAARFAKHQQVARVVAFCGPRDQHQNWQQLPSATPENRYFGFSHVLDGGWSGDHYCRSWELLGMHQFGPIVDVDQSDPPYENTRRLTTNFDVQGNKNRAHSGVTPGFAAYRDPKTKAYLHEAVWKYLFTHPIDEVGIAQPMDDECQKVHPQ